MLCTDQGFVPGTGAIVAAIAAASDVEPVFIGKPHTIMIEMGIERLGLPKAEIVIVGDNLNSDIRAGENAGVATILVLTGVSTREDLKESPTKPTWVVEDYEELEDLFDGI